MKQATHVQPNSGTRLVIHVCDWGGYMVGSTSGREDCYSGQAAFSSADECAEWVRSFLRNSAARTFGPKKET